MPCSEDAIPQLSPHYTLSLSRTLMVVALGIHTDTPFMSERSVSFLTLSPVKYLSFDLFPLQK